MRRLFLSITILLSAANALLAQNFDQDKMRYIEQFKYWAMDEQVRTGVPAAISLAQGILETGSGKSELCQEANNHFGIKCKKEWTGETYLHDDDRRHECFRKYKSAKDSYTDHSNFLATRAHYSFLFGLAPTDYTGWCNGLRKAGYATNPQYAARLIDLIEKYNLQQYTYEAIEIAKENNLAAEVVPAEDKETNVVEVAPATPKIAQEETTAPKRKVIFDKQITKNGRPGFWARKGDYLLPEAVQYNIRYAKLLAINDLADEPLYDDMFIYLKKKAKKGDRSYHIVKPGESMHSISQNTGVQLKFLYIYNNLYDLEEPAVGEKIYLQTRTSATPRLRGNPAPQNVNVTATKSETEEKQTEKDLSKEKAELAKIEAKQRALEKELRESELAAKKLEEAKEAAAQATLQKEREAAALARAKEKQAAELAAKKEAASQADQNAETTTILGTKGASPIIDFDKAKRVEKLMNDGSQEIQRLEYEKRKAEQAEKVIPAPAQRDPNIEKEKAVKTKQKQQAAKKKKPAKRKYDENVSDDVKDLKKKFDSLIYDD